MQFFKQQLKYLRLFSIGQRKIYLAMIVVGFLGTVAEGVGLSVFIPLLIDGEINAGEMTRNIKKFIHYSLGIPMTQNNILLLMIAVFSVRGFLRFLDAFLRGKNSAVFMHRIQAKLISNLVDLKFSEFQKKNRGELTTIFTTNVLSARLSSHFFASQNLGVISIISFTAIALLANYQMVIIALGIGLLVFYLQQIISQRILIQTQKNNVVQAKINNILIQTLSFLKYLKSTNTVKPLSAHLHRLISEFRDTTTKTSMLGGITQGMHQPASIFIFTTLVFYSSLVQNLPISIVIANMAVIQRLVSAILGYLSDTAGFAENQSALDSVQSELQRMDDATENLNGKKLAKLESKIEFSNVSLQFGEAQILKNLTFDIPAKSLVGFTGTSGSGISTLLDLITAIYLPSNGKILVDQVQFTEIDIREWQKSIGIVSQDVPIFNDTVFNNVTLWKYDLQNSVSVEKEVWNALTLALADDFVRLLPQGLQTPIGEKGVNISGGQKQRIAIARELFKRPRLLILDEATSALDSQTERAIQETLEALKGNITIILVAHRLTTLQLCEYLFVLEEGKLIESGSFDVLFSNTGSHFRKLWDSSSLAPKGPSTRIRPKDNEWRITLDVNHEIINVIISNISESGIAIEPHPTINEMPAGTDLIGRIEHGTLIGGITLRIIHKFAGSIGCQFVNLDPHLMSALGHYIKSRSSQSETLKI